MGKPTGFLEYERKGNAETPPLERIKDFHEFHVPMPEEERRRAVWTAACRFASPV